MNKTEFISSIAKEMNVTKKEAEDFVNTYAKVIAKTIARGKDTVQITGFGTYKASLTAAREGHNPQNPTEKIHIPESYRIYFSAGKNFKDAVNAAPKAKKVGKKVTKK